jgi:hypothetical protein
VLCLKYELILVLKELMYFLCLIFPDSLKVISLFVSSYTLPACPSYESGVKMNERVWRVGGTTLTGKHRGTRRGSARVPPRSRQIVCRLAEDQTRLLHSWTITQLLKRILCKLYVKVKSVPHRKLCVANCLKTTRIRFYLKNQSVPRSKHFSSLL